MQEHVFRPYIGITGFTTAGQAEAAVAFASEATKRNLMVGAIASHKSIRGIPMKPRWQEQTPALDVLQKIFRRKRNVLNLVHYNSEFAAKNLVIDLVNLEEMSGRYLDGFQLNIPWPDLDLLEVCHRNFKQRRVIVLQISEASLSQAGGTAKGLLRRLKPYEGLVHSLLLDGSSGEGKPLNTKRSRELLAPLFDARMPFHLGIAGGLGPDTMHLVAPLLQEFPTLSIDAQGKLRDAHNRLDGAAVFSYLEQAITLTSQ